MVDVSIRSMGAGWREIMRKKYNVSLTAGQRKRLEALLARGDGKATELRRARILLKADTRGPGWSDARIAEALECSRVTVENIRRRFEERGMDSLRRKKQPRLSRERKLDGKGEAGLLAIACGEPPQGRTRWTLHLLADRVVELRLAESISYETVRQTLKKAN